MDVCLCKQTNFSHIISPLHRAAQRMLLQTATSHNNYIVNPFKRMGSQSRSVNQWRFLWILTRLNIDFTFLSSAQVSNLKKFVNAGMLGHKGEKGSQGEPGLRGQPGSDVSNCRNFVADHSFSDSHFCRRRSAEKKKKKWLI